MKALLPGQKTERKVFNSSNWSWRTGFCLFYNVPFKNMKSMMTQCLQIAHEQGRKMDSELEAECLKTVFNCDYFWSKWNKTYDRESSDLIAEIKFVRIAYYESHWDASKSVIILLCSCSSVSKVALFRPVDRIKIVVKHSSFYGHWNSKDISKWQQK